MTDDTDDLAPVPDSRMMLRVAMLLAATGALGGAFEGALLAMRVPFLLAPPEVALLVAAAAALDGVVGLGIGLVGGAVAQFGMRGAPRWKRYRAGFAVGVVLLLAGVVAPVLVDLWTRQDRRALAFGTTFATLAIVVSAWFNSGYWFRREMIGAGPRLGWKVVCAGLGSVVLLAAAVLGGDPRLPLGNAPPDAPNLVLVTIDTLRRDHLGIYGGQPTPVLDRLGAEGLVLDNAVTPVPETAPSHASMLTGLHPASHGVIANGIRLRSGALSVAEQLDITGWRTGAFVSSFAVDSSTGLAQGFQVYDDDFVPFFRGVADTRVLGIATPMLMRLADPTDFPWLLERAAPSTIDRALGWVDTLDGAPFLLWVHLFEPHSPYEPHDGVATVDHRAILSQEPGYAYQPAEEEALRALYAEEVAYTDAQVGVLLAGLRERGALEGALVVVIADHGESLGEHGIHFNHHGLYDSVLRVPAIVWTDRPSWEPGMRIERQVWVGDVANTLLQWVDVPLLSNTSSVPMLEHARGVVVPPRPLQLLGRMTASLDEGQLYGVRDPTGVKYILRGGEDELYNLRSDPGETHDIAFEEPEAVGKGRSNVEKMLEVLDVPMPVGDPRLQALGYEDP